MLTSQRKALILETLRREGRIVAKTLAAQWDLSEDTIRRDLREMAREGLLSRVHGGALPLEPPLADYHLRLTTGIEEKQLLGRAGAALVEAGQLVFIDGGSTNLCLVAALPTHIPFTVVTHSPTIASALEHHPTAQIILIGGQIYRHSMVAVGAMAAEAIARVRPDLFFLGITAIHARYGLTTGDMEEAEIKRQIARQSKQCWVLATADKLDVASPVSIMPLDSATGIILARGIDPDKTHFLIRSGLRLVEA